jgi:hypothetical protein
MAAARVRVEATRSSWKSGSLLVIRKIGEKLCVKRVMRLSIASNLLQNALLSEMLMSVAADDRFERCFS